jgi:hypothetical protein
LLSRTRGPQRKFTFSSDLTAHKRYPAAGRLKFCSGSFFYNEMLRAPRKMSRSLSVIASILSLTIPAFAQKPVLAWSARTGPDLQFIAGTAVDSNGSVFVVARTPDSTDPFSPSFRNSDVFVSS